MDEDGSRRGPYHANIVPVEQDLGELHLGSGIIAAQCISETGNVEDVPSEKDRERRASLSHLLTEIGRWKRYSQLSHIFQDHIWHKSVRESGLE